MPHRTPLVIGHRGAPGHRPEHARSSYELAFASGVDAVEPDVVVSRDGVLVVRHENEISGTTDVADRPEFAGRRTTKTVDGQAITGWFTEDFTWDELSTLRCRERLPRIRPDSAALDDREPVLRLSDVLAMVDSASAAHNREIGVVLEIKHPTYFASVGFDIAAIVADELRAAGWAARSRQLTVESFESTVLGRVRDHGVAATWIYLLEASGRPADLFAANGADAPTYRATARPAGLDALVGLVDGISVAKRMILAPDKLGRITGPSRVVADAHERGMIVFTWTCRPENRFLVRSARGPGGPAAFGDYRAEWAVLRGSGVDGVFVDHPALGVAFFRDGSAPALG